MMDLTFPLFKRLIFFSSWLKINIATILWTHQDRFSRHEYAKNLFNWLAWCQCGTRSRRAVAQLYFTCQTTPARTSRNVTVQHVRKRRTRIRCFRGSSSSCSVILWDTPSRKSDYGAEAEDAHRQREGDEEHHVTWKRSQVFGKSVVLNSEVDVNHLPTRIYEIHISIYS